MAAVTLVTMVAVTLVTMVAVTLVTMVAVTLVTMVAVTTLCFLSYWHGKQCYVYQTQEAQARVARGGVMWCYVVCSFMQSYAVLCVPSPRDAGRWHAWQGPQTGVK
jgi:hypothetical protein